MIKLLFFRLKSNICKARIIPNLKNAKSNQIRPYLVKDVYGNRRTVQNNQEYISHKVNYSFFYGLKIIKMDVENSKQTVPNVIKPPECVKGMTSLDKSKFECRVKVPSLCVPVKMIRQLTKLTKQYQLKLAKLSPVVELDGLDPRYSSYKVLLLNPEKIQSYSELSTETRTLLESNSVTENDFQIYDIQLTYANWSFQDVMQAIMPDDTESVSGFAEVGHIAHFNLREHALPYKYIIGQVLLDKIPSVKTVVNKVNTIDNTYRTFGMELIAGENNFVTQTKENGFIYELDFSKVYWNTRLGTEHHRMVKDLMSTDVVFDVFAGIGPFAVPAAKRKATVFANDLNPYSYDSLVKNIKLNKCDHSCIQCFNLDGREFIQTVMKEELTKIYTTEDLYRGQSIGNITGITVLMNLPALAYMFLDAFSGLLGTVDNFSKQVPIPWVHCYCFTNLPEATEKFNGDREVEIKHRLVAVVKDLKVNDVTVRFVRNVAPQKDMMCASFQLTQQILCDRRPEKTTADSDNNEPPPKMQKTECQAN